MEENISKKKMLSIPANVTDRNEIFQGFGMEELKVVGIGAAIGGIMALIFAFITREFLAPLFAFIVPCYVAYVLSYRDRYSENLLEKFKYILEYSKQQKLYYYEYVPLVKIEEAQMDE